MVDRPILFSAPMVRALLAGTKTQTRRVLKPKKDWGACLIDPRHGWSDSVILDPGNASWLAEYVRWQIGDRLWVRETWAPLSACTHNDPGTLALSENGFYRADNGTVDGEISAWKPSIFMPRTLSRLTLTVTDVRVRRLQDISEDDAQAEGVYYQEPNAQDIAGYRAHCLEEYGTESTDEMRGVWIAPGTHNGYSKKGEDEKWGPTAAIAYRWVWEHINGPGSWEANPWVAALTFTVTKGNIDG